MYPNAYPGGQPSYPGGQQPYPGQPQYGAQPPFGSGMPQQPFGSGYPPMNQPGYPAMAQQGMPQPGMPQQGAYPQQPGYPQQTGYPQMPMGQQPGGYPQQTAGYPPAQQPVGFPPAQQPAGYPPAQQPAGYPPAQQPAGYPPAQQPAGYPPAQQPAGFPPTQQPGFPPAQQPGFPPAQQPGFPPAQQPGFPPAQQPGFPPAQQPGFPPAQQPGFPPAQQPGYPALPATGFPPAQQPGYPALPPNEQILQQHQYSQQNSAMPPQGVHSPPQQPYGQPPQQQQAYGQQPPQVYGSQGYVPQAMAPQGRPTLVTAPNFDASNDCAKLRKAMKGFGTDNDGLIEVICRRTNAQRFEINRAFKTCYGKDLLDEIKSETTANFQNILVACMTPLYEYYCNELYKSMSGQGTDEDVLIEVFCALTNYEIRSISFQYARIYGKSLEQEMKSDTSGSFKRLLVSLSCGSRDESMTTDINSAKADAQELKKAGVGRWGTDESAFNRILCMRNYAQLKLVCKEYEALTGSTLEKDIKKEFSGDIEDGLLAIVRCANNRSEFFARRLHKSMAGLGTTDSSLIRLVVTRCEHDMVDIKEAFLRLYGKTLKSYIKGDTSGDYKHALYALIGENRS